MSYRWRRTGKVRGKRPSAALNRSEEEYAKILAIRRVSGQIKEFWPHGITLLLAADCRYTPDFLVMDANDELEIIDVKGGKEKKVGDTFTGEATYWAEEDSKIKIKIAAEMYPFRARIAFKAPKKLGGDWHEVEV